MRIIVPALLIILTAVFAGNTRFKYVGAKKCGSCHESKREGRQYDIWRNSGHAGAYKTLSTKAAEDMAKKKKLKKSAPESAECLICHTINNEKFKEDGVQCESCHGPGSEYKSNSTMRQKEKAIANGMTAYRNDADIEKHCRTCHNKKSPTYKEFDFKSMWGEIKHPVPK